MTARAGFIGLGIMGQPMASRLAGAGIPLTVWNRSDAAAEALVAAGARRADNVAGVFAECETVLIMLRNEAVLDSVLRSGPGGLAGLVPGHTVVNIGTVSPAYSRNLAREIESAGGDFVEAPVSGSRRPPRAGHRPVRADHRHQSVHRARGPGNAGRAVRLSQAGLLDRGQRRLAPQQRGRSPAPRRLPQRADGAPARPRLLAESSGATRSRM
jgi:hypothetical protein